jgi:hypothetical protein
LESPAIAPSNQIILESLIHRGWGRTLYAKEVCWKIELNN